MNPSESGRDFDGSIPQLYEQYMVPLMFAQYAADMARRVVMRKPSRVLEVAAGTGVLTRELAKTLAPEVEIISTDLNQPMLDHAATLGTARPVEWKQADAMHLPFPDASFEVVVCQFGAMFFPVKATAFSEARRVLRPGGAFIFSVWDRIEENEFADTVDRALTARFPANPPRFMARIPHGYYDHSTIAQDLAGGGFSQSFEFTTLTERSRASSPHVVATAYCQGTPLRAEIEALGPNSLNDATDCASIALGKRFGQGEVESQIQAHVVTVER